MAVYAATITLAAPKAFRLGNSPIGLIAGSCNLSNYNQTLAEITAITKKFLSTGFLYVATGGESSLGYTVKWDHTGKAFKAFSSSGTMSGITAGAITASGTPSGTVAAPTLTTLSGTPATHPLGVVSGGGIVSDAVYSGITGVQAPAFSGASLVVSGAGPTITGTIPVGPDGEAASDTNIGTFDFIAFGQMG